MCTYFQLPTYVPSDRTCRPFIISPDLRLTSADIRDIITDIYQPTDRGAEPAETLIMEILDVQAAGLGLDSFVSKIGRAHV